MIINLLYNNNNSNNNNHYYYRNGFNKFRYCSESYLNQMREYIADIEIKDKISKTNIKNNSNNNSKFKVKVVQKRKSKKKKY